VPERFGERREIDRGPRAELDLKALAISPMKPNDSPRRQPEPTRVELDESAAGLANLRPPIHRHARFEPRSIQPQRSRRGPSALDPGQLHYLRPQLLRHGDPPAAVLRSPLRQPGMSKGQSRSSAHAQPRRRGYAMPIQPSRTVAARTRFDKDREWWVSGRVFERLFLSALEQGHLAPSLEEWRHVADANGGFSVARLAPEVARDLTVGLRAAARAGLARLGDVDLHTQDGTYKVSLEKFLAVTAQL
jgi:hypothetical protein